MWQCMYYAAAYGFLIFLEKYGKRFAVMLHVDSFFYYGENAIKWYGDINVVFTYV